jgi:hypothetical protein
MEDRSKMKKIVLIAALMFGLATPAMSFNDSWTDCNQWGDDIVGIALCRKAKMMRYQALQNQNALKVTHVKDRNVAER